MKNVFVRQYNYM